MPNVILCGLTRPSRTLAHRDRRQNPRHATTPPRPGASSNRSSNDARSRPSSAAGTSPRAARQNTVRGTRCSHHARHRCSDGVDAPDAGSGSRDAAPVHERYGVDHRASRNRRPVGGHRAGTHRFAGQTCRREGLWPNDSRTAHGAARAAYDACLEWRSSRTPVGCAVNQHATGQLHRVVKCSRPPQPPSMMLLGRRVAMRLLVPGAVVSAVLMTASRREFAVRSPRGTGPRRSGSTGSGGAGSSTCFTSERRGGRR